MVTKYEAKWGTYGKNGDEPLRYVRLVDCSTEHLMSILRTERQIEENYVTIIKEILSDRKVNGF